MTISFNSVPSALRVPFVAAEFDSSRAQQGPGELAFRALLVGQKTHGTASPNSLHTVTSADDVATLAGRGSQLHRMALAWFNVNKSTECVIGVLEDNTAAVNAEGSIVVSGAATADGTISLYFGGERVDVAVASGDSANTIASAIAAAIGKRATATVTAATALVGNTVTIDGTVFTAVAGAATPGDATFSIDTGNPETAASLVAQIKAHATASKKVTAKAAAAVVTLRARQPGTAGNALTLASSGATLAVSGATLSGGASGDNDDLAVHASVATATVTVHANNAGAVGNELDIRENYQPDSEATPAGVTLAITQPSAGATNPSLTALISAMGDTWYHLLAHPFTDATSLTSLETELADRFGPMRMIDGHAFTAKDDTLAAVGTLGDTRNSKHSSIIRTNDSPTPPGEYAAHVAAVAAYHLQIDPARPLQTLPLPFVKAPAEADRDTLEERNLLLYDGISTTKVGGGDLVQIERLITTSQTNAAGSPDTAYLSVETMFTLMFLRYSFRNRWATRYPRHKLANDGTRVAAGQAIMTPALARAECVAWFKDMMDLGLVEGLEQFKADLVVERNALNPNRLDITLPPDLINQLIVTAAQIQFRV